MTHTYESYRQYLEEKLIILGGDKKYDQVIILAGGAGSGKGFAQRHFMSAANYKIIDTDAMKFALINLGKKINDHEKSKEPTKKYGQKYEEVKPTFKAILAYVQSMKLKDPKNTATLHALVGDMGADDKQIINMFLPFTGTRSVLPNLLFDRTLKNEKAVIETTSFALNAGYKPENIHVVWVLTNYRIALKRNKQRLERRVYNDILFATHAGAADTMLNIVFKDYAKYGINGDIAVVIAMDRGIFTINGKKMEAGTVKIQGNSGQDVVTDFTYFRVKKAGVAGVDEGMVAKVTAFANMFVPPPVPNPKKPNPAAEAKYHRALAIADRQHAGTRRKEPLNKRAT